MVYYVYIMASGKNGTLYVGVTNDLIRRAYEHRNGLVEGFTRQYDVKRLVYFEETSDVQVALQREKNVKHWSRAWKLALIEEANPDWRDLYDDIVR
jgi:putative endonuclease